MKKHDMKRKQHLEAVQSKASAEIDKVAGAIAKRLDGWENKAEAIEMSQNRRRCPRQGPRARRAKGQEGVGQVREAAARLHDESVAKAKKLAEISAAVAAKRRNGWRKS